MQDETLKKTILHNYLKSQGSESPPPPQSATSNSTASPALPLDDINLSTITLEDFKKYVEKYFEVDNLMKKVSVLIKEKKKERNKLSEIITQFMQKYDIEDLNTKTGKIRCKKSFVKSPVSQKHIKHEITTILHDSDPSKKRIMQVFDNREKVEKVSLRRLKIS